jgi:2-oxoglutarate dehydrogenase E2 component (dihydrolipoamide succinyltransferase)
MVFRIENKKDNGEAEQTKTDSSKVDAERTKEDSNKVDAERTKEKSADNSHPTKPSSALAPPGGSKRDTSTAQKPSSPVQQQTTGTDPNKISGTRSETRVKMSRMRLKIAERLKEAQNTTAMLTTFNEIDMR